MTQSNEITCTLSPARAVAATGGFFPRQNARGVLCHAAEGEDGVDRDNKEQPFMREVSDTSKVSDMLSGAVPGDEGRLVGEDELSAEQLRGPLVAEEQLAMAGDVEERCVRLVSLRRLYY